MTDFDLTKLPTGELGRRALLEYVKDSDDRVERYFLEVKSDIDLNSKSGRAKVAKFVLAAANRDPVRSAKRFDGCAILVIGVGGGQAPGVGAFEAHELADAVTKFIGADGPSWDFERIRVDQDHDVIMVVVDRPVGEDQPWTCRADGLDGLVDGGIYVRGDGDTRRATGDEVREMTRRRSSGSKPIEIEVSIEADVVGCRVDEQPFLDEINRVADAMVPPTPGRQSVAGMVTAARLLMPDRRSRAQFEAEVEEWREAALGDPFAGVRGILAKARPGICIKVINKTMTYLRDVRLDIEFDGPVRALEWEPAIEKGDDISWLPGDRPEPWGTDSLSSLAYLPPIPRGSLVSSNSRDGITTIKKEEPAQLTLHFDDLRSDETRLSDDDDVVLIVWPIDTQVETVTARWRLTAAEVHGVFSGELELPVQRLDLDAYSLFSTAEETDGDQP